MSSYRPSPASGALSRARQRRRRDDLRDAALFFAAFIALAWLFLIVGPL